MNWNKLNWNKLICRIFGHKRPSMNHTVASALIWGMIQEQGNEKPVAIHCKRCGEILDVIA